MEPLAIRIASNTLNSGHVLNLKDCLFLPNTFRNVMSILRLVRDGYELSFTSNACHIHYGNDALAWVLW